MRVLVFWEPAGLTLDRSNPYACLLARALLPLGVECVAAFRENLSPEWLRDHRHEFQVIHLHWPWGLYGGGDLAETVSRCSSFLDSLFLARSLGYKVVWTMHNVYPHDTNTPDLDHIARLAIVSCASAVIVHCERASDLLRDRFHRSRRVFLAPHGHFRDAYPNTVTRDDARRRFGFSDGEFVYLFFGNVRANKGVERLLDAFLAMPGDDLRFLFAARICSEYGARVVERARDSDRRIVLTESPFYPHDELQWFFNAADVAVFPFTDILTSGSAITALSFGCPVIGPAIGCLPQAVDSSVGALYDPGSPEALPEALRCARRRRREEMLPAIERRLEELSWDGIARTTLEAYRS
jgi:glycosyltransferase involved in cell wall biosynthesis